MFWGSIKSHFYIICFLYYKDRVRMRTLSYYRFLVIYLITFAFRIPRGVTFGYAARDYCCSSYRVKITFLLYQNFLAIDDIDTTLGYSFNLAALEVVDTLIYVHAIELVTVDAVNACCMCTIECRKYHIA